MFVAFPATRQSSCVPTGGQLDGAGTPGWAWGRASAPDEDEGHSSNRKHKGTWESAPTSFSSCS